MNRAICINTWREFKGNAVRLILLTLAFLAPLVSFTFQRCTYPATLTEEQIAHPSIAILFALLWGCGVIGKERQNGTIGLVLARPITISNYVTSKWFAVGLAASVCAVQALIVEHAVSIFFTPSLWVSTEFLTNALERVIIAFGISAVLIFYSSLVSGLKDLALLAGTGFGLMLIAQMLSPFSYSRGSEYEQNLAHHAMSIGSYYIVAIFYPNIPLADLINGGGEYLYYILNYFTVVTVFLSLAVFFLRRKEFSYAQD